MDFPLSKEELVSFHTIDREVFARLVIGLGCDPNLALWVMGLWLWLEEQGFPSVVYTVGALADNVVSALFQEAVTILNFIRSGNPPYTHPCNIVPRTYILLQEHLTFQSLYENGVEALNGIIKTVNEVCARAFADITPQYQGNMRRIVEIPTAGRFEPREAVLRTREAVLRTGNLNIPVLPYIPHAYHPGFRPMLFVKDYTYQPHLFRQHPSEPLFHTLDARLMSHFEVGESSNPARTSENETAENRTLFTTFSKGYPISEFELSNYFLRNYGDVIEEIQMEETAPGVQPLWARVVMRSSATVALVLNGHEKIKFVINRKHVWTRRFVSRD